MGSKRCPYCGAYLDPGEKCDCWDDESNSTEIKEDEPLQSNSA